MSPEARSTAVALFSAAVYLGQTLGVALFAPAIDHIGGPPVFIVVAVLLPLLGWWFATRLRRRALEERRERTNE
jgi:predicted MFS family arabinose efflux permease